MSDFQFRGRDEVEGEIVVERGAGMLAAIEVKATATLTDADYCGLHKLKQAAGKRFNKGIVLYDGEISPSFGGFYAVPDRRLWEAA